MRIILDAMGSDKFPTPEIDGTKLFLDQYPNAHVVLVGDEAVIKAEMVKQKWNNPQVEIIHTDEFITSNDHVTDIVKLKSRSSMLVGMRLAQENGDAFVTMGNSAVALAIATLNTFRRIRHVQRPVMVGKYRLGGNDVILLDIGANTVTKPDWMAEHAFIGSLYAQVALNISKPRVALLSVGEEEGKGGERIIEASNYIRKMPVNYVGNIEPKQVVQGLADVIVMDGFTGNIVLKTYESTMRYMGSIIRQEFSSDMLSKLGYLVANPVLRRIRNRVTNLDTAGGLLLGVNGVVIIGHGSTDAREVKNCFVQAQSVMSSNIVQIITDAFAKL